LEKISWQIAEISLLRICKETLSPRALNKVGLALKEGRKRLRKRFRRCESFKLNMKT